MYMYMYDSMQRLQLLITCSQSKCHWIRIEQTITVSVNKCHFSVINPTHTGSLLVPHAKILLLQCKCKHCEDKAYRNR